MPPHVLLLLPLPRPCCCSCCYAVVVIGGIGALAVAAAAVAISRSRIISRVAALRCIGNFIRSTLQPLASDSLLLTAFVLLTSSDVLLVLLLTSYCVPYPLRLNALPL